LPQRGDAEEVTAARSGAASKGSGVGRTRHPLERHLDELGDLGLVVFPLRLEGEALLVRPPLIPGVAVFPQAPIGDPFEDGQEPAVPSVDRRVRIHVNTLARIADPIPMVSGWASDSSDWRGRESRAHRGPGLDIRIGGPPRVFGSSRAFRKDTRRIYKK
jgi:hypothetical protein